MNLHVFLTMALAIVLALLSSKLMKAIRFPNVTGYLLVGLIVGPYCLNLIPLQFTEQIGLLSEIALGFIALSIGAEFKLSYLKKVGKSPVIIAFLEGFMAVIVVDAALIFLKVNIPFALCLGAIAAATAPAATLMIIKQYKAKGPLTETLLPVVAIDDAVALIAFGLSTAIAKVLMQGQSGSFVASLIKPIFEIILSFGLGAVLGIIYAMLTKWFTGRGNRLSVTIGMLLICLGVSDTFGLSSLLCVMMMSAVYVNISSEYTKVFEIVDRMTPPLFMLFFFFSGAELNLGILPQVGFIGIVYLLFRVFGKVFGAWLGCKICKTKESVSKYLGLTLIPQAGVAIGLATTALTIVPQFGTKIRTIILCSTVIYELVGPLITKIALKKAHEII
ncbi:MAG: cation:proton antiporter [Erysipelotrichaceae bacterium]|nr:cation:proton antiporter [Erysipelotrichaceae bacterium]